MSIQIKNEYPLIPIQLTAVQRLLARCCTQLRLKQPYLSVLLTDDNTIKKMNQKYRGRNQPTDILSFSMREYTSNLDPLPPHPEVLGDLVVSLPTVQRQARSQGVATQNELEWILIHGLLHLLGYDHVTMVDKLRMERHQMALLALARPQKGKRSGFSHFN